MLYQQPQHGPAQVDWENPITRGMSMCVSYGTSSVNLVNRKVVDTVNASGYSLSPLGRARTLSYAAASQDIFTNPGVSGDITILCFGTQGTIVGSTGALLGGLNNGSGAIRYAIGEVNNALKFYTNPSGGSFVQTTIIGGGVGSGVFIGRVSGTTQTGWLNGSQVSSASQTTSNWSDITSTEVGGSTFTGATNGNVLLAAIWNRALSDAELVSLSANPWQLILDEDEEETLLFVQGGGGGPLTYSYTATGGFVLSGTVPNIKSRLKSGAGGLTFAGTSPAIRGADRRASGGLTFGGSTRAVRERLVSALGGVLFSGAAGLSFFASVQSLVVTASGGINFAGAATKVRGIVRTVTGGVVFGGSSAVTLTPDPNPTTQKHFKRGRRPRTKV